MKWLQNNEEFHFDFYKCITKEFYDTLSKLNKEKGLTIIMATHDLDEVENENARVICMATEVKFDGNIKEWKGL